jgi:hypothetical protein
MRDVVGRFDFCSYLIVAIALQVVVNRVAYHFPRFARGMWWTAIATLLVVGGLGYAEVQPAEPMPAFGVAIVAWICASAAALASIVLVPPFASLFQGWKDIAAERERRAEQQRREHEEERQRAALEEQAKAAEQDRRRAEALRLEAERLKPRPPTRAERITEAKAKYEAALALIEESGLVDAELRAAKLKAKQEYLKDLEQVLS